jgi:hypothetical protein
MIVVISDFLPFVGASHSAIELEAWSRPCQISRTPRRSPIREPLAETVLGRAA